MLADHEQYIPLSDCKHGWLYKIESRNLTLGVYREDRKGFVGIREKFGHLYLFVEFHWDTGPPFGTVKPLERLEPCPIQNLDEYIHSEDEKLELNKDLFEWLKQKGGLPGDTSKRKHLEDLKMLKEIQEQQRKK